MKALIAGGADVNRANKDGITALMIAARLGFADIVQALLDSGANADMVSKTGANALSLAQANNKADVVQILEQHAAASAAP